MSRNFLSKDEELRQGDHLISNNGEWKAVFQGDGNFVIYGWKPVWASDTDGSDAFRLIMQADSNVVIYNSSGTARWHTDTCVKNVDLVCRLQLTDDGKLVLCRKAEEEVWTSASSKGKKV